jgi:antibiotic biosynthesis monooxygenase (ABM) superfamily enzyme
MLVSVTRDGIAKGIIGYKALDYTNLERLLMQLRLCAVQYPGFIDADYLLSDVNHSIGLMMSTWQTVEDWRRWVGSRVMQELLRRARTVLTGSPGMTVYNTLPTEEWY